MEKRSKRTSVSEFSAIAGIEYFDFEEDFIEKNIRCIPMIVRYKMDLAGIKLKLDEWTRLVVEERIELATRSCSNNEETRNYRYYLAALVKKRSHREATDLKIDRNPGWADLDTVPEILRDRLFEDGWSVSLDQWKKLTNLQRFALLKLCRPGHESKNFAKALREFGLTSSKLAFAD
jgi:hypothetical protein